MALSPHSGKTFPLHRGGDQELDLEGRGQSPCLQPSRPAKPGTRLPVPVCTLWYLGHSVHLNWAGYGSRILPSLASALSALNKPPSM